MECQTPQELTELWRRRQMSADVPTFQTKLQRDFYEMKPTEENILNGSGTNTFWIPGDQR